MVHSPGVRDTVRVGAAARGWHAAPMNRLLLPLALVLASACATTQSTSTNATPSPTAATTAARPTTEKAAPADLNRARTMSVHLLDVGQGAATLLEFPCGAVLVDTGGEQNPLFDAVPALVRQLDAFFATRPDLQRTLELLVITHPHLDHVRGIPAVLEHYVVKRVVDNGMRGESHVSSQEEALHAFIDAHHLPYRAVKLADVGADGLTDDVIDPIACAEVDPTIRVLWGAVAKDPGWGSRDGRSNFDNANNHSVVTRVDFGRSSIVITGDLEVPGIKGLLEKYAGTHVLATDVYEVGHHGSWNGTTPALVHALMPQVALIGMGPPERQDEFSAWAFGHPRKVTLDALNDVSGTRAPLDVQAAVGPHSFVHVVETHAVYATGWDGPVVVDMDDLGDVHVR